MTRVVMRLAGLFGVLAGLVLAIAFVVPVFLPKDTIRAELIAQIETRTGLRLALDGPVRLALLPGLRLEAERVGIAAGEGGELLRVGTAEFGLAWSTLFGGTVRLTHIVLDAPVATLGAGSPQASRPGTQTAPAESGAATGATGFPADRWSAATQAISDSRPADTAAGRAAMLARIGVDRLTLRDGVLQRADGGVLLDGIDVDIALPSLAGAMDIDGQIRHRGLDIGVRGTVAAPLALADGGSSAVDLVLTAAGGEARLTGDAALAGEGRLRLAASGDRVGELLAAFGIDSPADPGAYSLTLDLATRPTRIDIPAFTAALGPAQLAGAAAVDLAGAVPAIEARLTLDNLAFADLLALAGRAEEGRGTLAGEVRLATRGADAAALLGGLDMSGRLTLAGGGVSGLDLPGPLAADPAAGRIDDLALAIEFAGLAAPVSLDGGLTWRGEAFRIDGSLTPSLIAAGLPAPARLRLAGQPVTLGYDGAVEAGGGLSGDVVIETASLRRLAAWLGRPLPEGGGLERFSFAGTLAADADGLAFRASRFALDDTVGAGEGRLDLSGKPKLTARLDLERLGLDPYLAGATGGAAGKDAASRVPGAEPRGWSRAPIDLSGLAALDAELTIATERIVAGRFETGAGQVALALSGGRLEADLTGLEVYGGSGEGRLVLDGAGSVAEAAAGIRLAGVGGRGFLAALAGFDWIEGTLALQTDLVACGTSPFELVASLAGTAWFDFADGSIRGINIPRMVRGLTVDTLLGWADNPAQRTDFSALGAGFEIARGIAVSQDLALVGPLVRMTGAGRVDLPEKSLDWRLEPRVVPTLDGAPPVPLGKGETRELQGLGVPVIVRGPWDRPQIYPDVKGILEDPQAALKQLESLGGDLVRTLSTARRAGEEGGGSVGEVLTGVANEAIGRATGGTGIDVQKVIDGEVDDQQVLDAVEQGFGLPQGFLGSFGLGPRQRGAPPAEAPIDAPVDALPEAPSDAPSDASGAPEAAPRP